MAGQDDKDTLLYENLIERTNALGEQLKRYTEHVDQQLQQPPPFWGVVHPQARTAMFILLWLTFLTISTLCTVHGLRYWTGSPAQERLDACVSEKDEIDDERAILRGKLDDVGRAINGVLKP